MEKRTKNWPLRYFCFGMIALITIGFNMWTPATSVKAGVATPLLASRDADIVGWKKVVSKPQTVGFSDTNYNPDSIGFMSFEFKHGRISLPAIVNARRVIGTTSRIPSTNSDWKIGDEVLIAALMSSRGDPVYLAVDYRSTSQTKK
jgi:hypothetical protein